MVHERILVVDDNLELLALCGRILQTDGYIVTQTNGGEKAISLLTQGGIDLLLTDIHLPGLSGMQIAGKLRELGLDVPVVAMTGYGNMEMAIQALSLGMDEFIVKPFTADHLCHVVSRALEKSRLRRENARLKALLPLFENSKAFVHAGTREHLRAQIVQALAHTAHADDVILLETIPDSHFLTVVAAIGKGLEKHIDEKITELPSRSIIENSSQVHSWKGKDTAGFPFLTDVSSGASVLAAPLFSRDERIGYLVAYRQAEYSESDHEAAAILAGQAAVALENAQLIGEISRAYQELRELDRLKSKFINIAAHELRTPLSVLMGYAFMLLEDLSGEQRQRMEYIVSNAERLRRLAEDLLSLRYLETGETELRLEAFDVAAAVAAVVEAYRTLAVKKRQSIEVVLLPGAGAIEADRAMIDLMLGNLLSNAIKFSPTDTQIRVEAFGDEDQATIAVRDRGPGLPISEQQKIFQRFYQVESSLTRQHEGLGLGLAITREMVRAHDGRIWIESKVGKGSAFFISIPRRPAQKNQSVS